MWHRLSRRPSGHRDVRTLRHRRRPTRAALRSLETLGPRRLLSDTWYVDSRFSGPSDGSQRDPFTTIQAAINVARPGDTVLVETGKGYSESDTIDGSDLTIEADGGASPVLDGSNGGGVGFTVTAGGVTISGLAIRGFSGGSIANDGGTVTVTNCTISDNRKPVLAIGVASSATLGGGIGNVSGTMTVTDCTIVGNEAPGGGGVFNYRGTLTITNSTLTGNGGGDLENDDGTVTITGSGPSSGHPAVGGSTGVENSGAPTSTTGLSADATGHRGSRRLRQLDHDYSHPQHLHPRGPIGHAKAEEAGRVGTSAPASDTPIRKPRRLF